MNCSGRLSKDLSTDCGPYLTTARNPYKDFFDLVSISNYTFRLVNLLN